MNELPLHPALVHLPIAMFLFAPLFTAYVVREIARFAALSPAGDSDGRYGQRRWRLVVAWAFVQTALIYGTMVTGERDVDLVDAHFAAAEKSGLVSPGTQSDFIKRSENHEDAATALLLISGAVLFLALIAMKPTPTAHLLRYGTIGVQILVLGVGLLTARLGGELVYAHDASDAHRLNQALEQTHEEALEAAP